MSPFWPGAPPTTQQSASFMQPAFMMPGASPFPGTVQTSVVSTASGMSTVVTAASGQTQAKTNMSHAVTQAASSSTTANSNSPQASSPESNAQAATVTTLTSSVTGASSHGNDAVSSSSTTPSSQGHDAVTSQRSVTNPTDVRRRATAAAAGNAPAAGAGQRRSVRGQGQRRQTSLWSSNPGTVCAMLLIALVIVALSSED